MAYSYALSHSWPSHHHDVPSQISVLETFQSDIRRSRQCDFCLFMKLKKPLQECCCHSVGKLKPNGKMNFVLDVGKHLLLIIYSRYCLEIEHRKQLSLSEEKKTYSPIRMNNYAQRKRETLTNLWPQYFIVIGCLITFLKIIIFHWCSMLTELLSFWSNNALLTQRQSVFSKLLLGVICRNYYVS